MSEVRLSLFTTSNTFIYRAQPRDKFTSIYYAMSNFFHTLKSYSTQTASTNTRGMTSQYSSKQI